MNKSIHGAAEKTSTGFGIQNAWFLVFALAFAYLLSFMDRMVITLMAEAIKRDLGLSDTQLGLLMGFSFAMFYSVFGLPIGRLADRANRKYIIITGIIVWSVATALCGFAQGFWLLFVARVVVGAGEAALNPAALSMIADKFPQQKRGVATGVFITGGQIGSAIAFTVGGALVGWLQFKPPIEGVPFVGSVFAWQSVFWMAGACGLIAIAFLAVTVEPRRGAYDEGGGKNEPVPLREVLRFLIHHKEAHFAILLAPALFAHIVFAVVTWAPAFFLREFDWSLETLGPIFGVIILLTGLSSPAVAGAVVQFLERRGISDAPLRTFLLFGVPGSVALLAFPHMPNGVVATILLALGLFAMTAILTIPQIALQNSTPATMRSQVAAILFLLLNLIGMGAGPVAVGLLTDYVFREPAALKWALSLLIALFAPLAILLCQRGRRGYSALVSVSKEP